ncbi:adenylosuccinate lyase [candidate division KSB1 bacterium]|nr:adenylosuccinate lyase [candidate division KSB1 bacterium]RQW01658.1 MAG: adenylosuccinate lyase [candidate division KSB1 bacterium]
MIARYTRPEMGSIWSDENKYRTWLRVEIAACDAQAELGRVPKDAVKVIREKADFSLERILQIEQKVKHDVIAFLTNVAEYIGPESRYVHLGMTSSDLLDTALAIQLQQASAIITDDLKALISVLEKQALEHKYTVCIGRSHGIHAEPTTFGLKMALWYDEMKRNLERFERAARGVARGMISGAVGTFAFLDPKVQEIVCQKLGLQSTAISTQVIQRDVHADYMTVMALIGATIEKIAIEIRHLQRTEVLEAEEPFTKGQKGSSAMPHKRNPIGCENLTGIARLLRANAMAALENVALWHERDISHSSVERIILPDSTILTDYALARMSRILQGLVVYPQNMHKNLWLTNGLIFSQAVLLALTENGMSREKSYQIVQDRAMECWQSGENFKSVISKDNEVTKILSSEQIESCFDEKRAIQHVDYIYAQVGLE